jgi:hypothetical protein
MCHIRKYKQYMCTMHIRNYQKIVIIKRIHLATSNVLSKGYCSIKR